MRAVLKNPGAETGWILLAAVSPTDQAIKFLTKAISINPANAQARKGLHWAVKKNRSNPQVIDNDGKKSQPAESSSTSEPANFSWLNLILRKAFSSIFILLVIALITLLTLHLADLGKARIPIEFDQDIIRISKFSQYLNQSSCNLCLEKRSSSRVKLVGHYS